MIFKTMFAIICIAVMAPNAQAQNLGDAKAGLEYAKKVCAECHGVTTNDFLSPSVDAPSFKDIANTPGMNERALIVWFRSPHPTMPNFILKTQHEDDVIAYIVSLKDED